MRRGIFFAADKGSHKHFYRLGIGNFFCENFLQARPFVTNFARVQKFFRSAELFKKQKVSFFTLRMLLTNYCFLCFSVQKVASVCGVNYQYPYLFSPKSARMAIEREIKPLPFFATALERDFLAVI